MKTVLFVIAVLICVMFPAIGEDISATGYGVDRQAARDDALSMLARQISTNVSTLVMSSTVDDGVSVSFQYGESSFQTSDMNLIGVQYGEPVYEDGLWSVAVVLPSSAADLYFGRLESTAQDIANLYHELGELGDLSSISYGQLDQLESLLSSFEVDRIVATSLDRGRFVPELPVSRSQVEAKMAAKMASDEDSLTMELDEYDLAEAFGLLNAEMETDRRRLETELEALRKNNARRIEELKAETRERLFELGGHTDVVTPEASQDASLAASTLEDLASIRRHTIGIDAIQNTTRTMIESLSDIYCAEVDDFIAAESGKDYPLVALGDDGKPTQTAIEQRHVGLLNEARSNFADSCIAEMNAQLDTSLSLIISNIESIALLVRSVDGKSVTLSSGQSNLSVAINGFEDESFVGTVQLVLAGLNLELDISIPCYAWIGQEIPDPQFEYLEYEEYLFVVSQWLSLLKDNAGLADVELSFSIHYDPVGHGLYLCIDSYSVTRLDTGTEVMRIGDAAVKPIMLVELPFDFSELFVGGFPNIDSYLSANFDYRSRIDHKVQISGVVDAVDIYGLKLSNLPDEILQQLEEIPATGRILLGADWFHDWIAAVMDRLDEAQKKEARRQAVRALFAKGYMVEPFASVGGMAVMQSEMRDDLALDSESTSEMIGRGVSATVGLSAFYKFLDNYDSGWFNFALGLYGNLVYTHAEDRPATWLPYVVSDNVGGSVGFELKLLFAGRNSRAAFVFGLRYGLAWLPEICLLSGVDLGVYIPAGPGHLTLAFRTNLFPALTESVDPTVSILESHISLAAGYAFSL